MGTPLIVTKFIEPMETTYIGYDRFIVSGVVR